MSIFSCDFEDCDRALDEAEVQGIALCLHEVSAESDGWEHIPLAIDLCPTHFEVVTTRILASTRA